MHCLRLHNLNCCFRSYHWQESRSHQACKRHLSQPSIKNGTAFVGALRQPKQLWNTRTCSQLIDKPSLPLPKCLFAFGLVWKNPKGFLISTKFRGSSCHFHFGHFYIEAQICTFEDSMFRENPAFHMDKRLAPAPGPGAGLELMGAWPWGLGPWLLGPRGLGWLGSNRFFSPPPNTGPGMHTEGEIHHPKYSEPIYCLIMIFWHHDSSAFCFISDKKASCW